MSILATYREANNSFGLGRIVSLQDRINMDFPKKVLLIDDDYDEYDILNSALIECCKEVELIYEKNANTALLSMANDNADTVADIIFLDWRMPRVSGKDVLIGIRNIPQYRQIPIVIFTGNLDPAHLNEAKELGATFLMEKPFDLTDLYQKLDYLFSLDWRHVKSPGQQI